MRLALTDLYHAKWTQEIHKEWMRNLLKNRPDLTIERLEIDAQHPDEFLRHLLDLATAKIIATVQETRKGLKNPPKSSSEYLAILAIKIV